MLTNVKTIQGAVRQLFDAADAVAVQGYDGERRVVYWNTGSERLYGYTNTEALGRKIEDLICPERIRESVIAAHSAWLDEGVEIPSSEIILCNKRGEDVTVFSSHVLFTDEQNVPEMYCIDIDLAETKRAQAQIDFKDRMLEAVFQATPDLYFLVEEDGTVIDHHANNNENLYVSPVEFTGKRMTDFLPATVAKQFAVHLREAVLSGCVSIFEYELNMAHGLSFFEARISHLNTYKQNIIVVRDITEQHKSAEVIRRHAYFDSLTSLPNRFLSLDRLSQLLEEAKRSGERFVVLFLDLDDFKKVNDSLGHEIGDKLLVEAANRLRLAVRKADTVGRLGGDEFIVLLKALVDERYASDVAENLLKVFREPFRIDGRELSLTMSIGIAVYPENGVDASILLRNADTAMYQAKALGRNTYSFFTKAMNQAMLRRAEIEDQMHSALKRNEFEVYYQPKLDVKSGMVVGAEALLRWHNATLGDVNPSEFIPIAEHTGLIVPIGRFVVAQALSFLSEWQRIDHTNYTMAVNLSPRQFRDKELSNFVRRSLSDANINPASLEFEITEGVLMIGETYIDSALSELQELGITLAMDDFGTGYSSLNYLRQYAFDVLKIDRSFIDGIVENKKDYDLVKATIAMAHSLGLLVVAEGVELREQWALLMELKCDLVQGFYFSEPLRAKELIDFHYAISD